MPPLHSCATSQNVTPAFGKRSEIGMKADPMMPKACSMPCICKTFTKASSVVIFMAASLFVDLPLRWPGSRFEFSREHVRSRSSIHGLEYLGEFVSGTSQHRQMRAAVFDTHAGLRRLDGDAGEQFAVAAQHRHGDADHAIEEFLAVVRHLLLSDLPQLGFEAGRIDNRLLDAAARASRWRTAAAVASAWPRSGRDTSLRH